jgi:prepilin-type N-terminal cleavage/methylation domain-containing protein
MTDKSGERGFTLVEVVIVGVLMSVLALGAFFLFMMYTNAERETVYRFRLQRQAEALVDEISRNVRNASFVSITETEALPGTADEHGSFIQSAFDEQDSDGIVVAVIKQIVVRDSVGAVRTVFQLRYDGDNVGTVLMDGEPFMVGGMPVQVDFLKSNFEVRADRRQVRINVVLRAVANDGTPFTLTVQRGVFRCRN